MFVLLFGLSMDYHVFILSRIRELRLGGASTRDAVTGGIARSAGVVTSAAVIMVAVFSIFATLSMIEFKMFGVAMAVAVLIDATVVRGILLPAGLALLGDRAWTRGPSGSRRVLRAGRTSPAYAATAPVTCSEQPRTTNRWSRTRVTAESMSSARSTEWPVVGPSATPGPRHRLRRSSQVREGAWVGQGIANLAGPGAEVGHRLLAAWPQP